MMVRGSSWKRGLAALCAGAVMLATGACSSMGGDEDLVTAPPPVQEEALPTLPPPDIPTSEEAVEKNRVALLLPVSGSNARVGRSLANAASMALDDLGEVGIELEVYDTAAGAERAAERAIADGAGLFLGPLLAENVSEIRSIARGRNIPVISFSNDAEIAGGGVYIMGFQPNQSIERVVGYARSQGMGNFAALVPQGVYGRRASQAFLAAVRDAGGRVTAIETYERKRSALTAAVRRLTDFDARSARAASRGVVRSDGTVRNVEENMPPVSFDALLIADGGAIASEFLQSLGRFDAGPDEVKYLGTELWNADPRIAQAQGLHGSLFASVPDARFRQLAQRFKTRYGGQPSRLASLAYDATLLAAGIARDWPLDRPFPVDRLTDPDGFVGIDGIFRFGANGIAQRGMEVQQVAPGGSRTVSPAPSSFQNRRVSMLVPEDLPGGPGGKVLAYLN